MPFDIGPNELIVIAVVLVFFFGAKKIPEFAKMFADGIKSLRSGFKDEVIAQDTKKS